jgi:hypothetical protein
MEGLCFQLPPAVRHWKSNHHGYERNLFHSEPQWGDPSAAISRMSIGQTNLNKSPSEAKMGRVKKCMSRRFSSTQGWCSATACICKDTAKAQPTPSSARCCLFPCCLLPRSSAVCRWLGHGPRRQSHQRGYNNSTAGKCQQVQAPITPHAL